MSKCVFCGVQSSGSITFGITSSNPSLCKDCLKIIKKELDKLK